jgi:sec-independent protein translocase protein TatA
MNTLALWPPSPMEMLVLMIICLLLFGKRLPEVGRSLGKGIVEFKKGLKGIDEEVDQAASRPAPPPRQELTQQTAYRQPLAEGEDRRVSRADQVEAAPAPHGTTPSGQG